MSALQPLLHDLAVMVAAPTAAVSTADGQIRPAGAQGVFHADRRALCQAVLRVGGREPEPIGYTLTGPATARFTSLARWLGDPGPDPTVRIDRYRTVTPVGLVEELVFASTAEQPVRVRVSLDLACDAAGIDTVKAGRPAPAPLPAHTLRGTGPPTSLRWSTGAGHVTASAEQAQASARGPAARLGWVLDLPAGGRVSLRWRLVVHDPAAVVSTPRQPVEWVRPAAADGGHPPGGDRRLARLLARSLDDLAGLRLVEPGHPGDTFLGAGVPWFLTLFGRDSIWAARMLLPLGTGLAAGTLRTLARRQGRRTDPDTGEQPGKILHELRRQEFAISGGRALPPAYYGTVDATPLWISLLHDAWRAGLAEAEVAALLPHLQAALDWLDRHADPDGDGFIEYLDPTGHGLANQGWKDSGDAIRHHDGQLAVPPIALCEVQGYACQAAWHAAALLDAFGRPGAARWREYAAALARRFRARFWVDTPHGRHPALALDAGKRPVDALTSNIGHLLGTGLLTPDESATVAALVTSPAMSSGYGLRTMSTQDAGYRPMSYHCGSVWPHDTAIVLTGLARAGHHAEAGQLADGLLAAAEAFDYRLPELYSGDSRRESPRPVPYPAACRPQAWSAAAAVAVWAATTGAAGGRPD